jgi:hypothetical protein
VWRELLRARLFGPLKLQKVLMHAPRFVRVFYRLMKDTRVSSLAKMVPLLGMMMLITPPALELDFVPIIGELDWLLVGYLTLKLFLWMCPPDVVREHVAHVARGA